MLLEPFVVEIRLNLSSSFGPPHDAITTASWSFAQHSIASQQSNRDDYSNGDVRNNSLTQQAVLEPMDKSFAGQVYTTQTSPRIKVFNLFETGFY